MQEQQTEVPTSNQLTTNEITFDIRKNVIGDFLCGNTIEDISSKNLIPKSQVASILRNSPRTQAVLARSNFASAAIRENARIMELKMNFYNFVDDSITNLKQKDNREVSLPILQSLIESIDKTTRLNIDKPTENKQETTKHVDIAETLKALKTDEDKMQFLISSQPMNV